MRGEYLKLLEELSRHVPVLKVFEAFSGMGAQHKALENLGITFTIVGTSEYDPKAAKAYAALHGDDIKNYGDITKITDFPYMDFLTYSFPCQDLSYGGKKKGMEKGSGTRSSLVWEVKKAVEQRHPPYMLMENVSGINSPENLPQFEEWQKYLESQGYENNIISLNSADFGVPQARTRIFMVSILKKLGKKIDFYDFTPKKVAFSEILDTDSKNYVYVTSPSMLKAIKNKKIKVLDPKAKAGEYDATANTLTTKQDRWNISVVKTNKGIRFLTPLETMRLMGFSDEDYQKLIRAGFKKTNIFKLTGNSIVVNVLMHLFVKMFM